MRLFTTGLFLIVSLIIGCGKDKKSGGIENYDEFAIYKVIGCQKSDRVMDVVFIHGVDGHHLSTWHPSENEKAYWPEWIGEDLENVGVWSINYPVATSPVKGHTMSLIDRATSILSALRAEGFSDTPDRPLVFIGHSFGGLVIKRMLQESFNSTDKEFREILNRCSGVVLIATPNSGSDLADYFSFLDRQFKFLKLSTETIEDLKRGNDNLLNLNQWYRDHSPTKGISTLVFAEGRKTSLYGVEVARVVSKESADPGIPGVKPIPMDEDHITISKPQSKEDTLYKETLRFLKARLQRAKPPTMPDPAGPIEKGGASRIPTTDDVEKSPLEKAEDVVITIKNNTGDDIDLAMYDWSRHYDKQKGLWSYFRVEAGKERLFENFETKDGSSSVGSTGWYSIYVIKPDNSVTRCLSTENLFNTRKTNIVINEENSDFNLEIKVDE